MARRSKAVDTKAAIKGAPWNIVFFSIGMYVVVYGLGNAGLTSVLAGVIQELAEEGLFIATITMGFIAAILSAIMNNMPTVMIDALAIAETNTTGVIREALVYGNIIGSDLRSKDHSNWVTCHISMASCIIPKRCEDIVGNIL
jgi:arsenical pump membrane protein